MIFVTHSVTEASYLSDRVLVMTPRPGRLAQVVEVAIPRPRDLDVMATAEFGASAKVIRELLHQKGGID